MSSLSSAPFGRIVTAMVTPFAADGSLDLPLAARLAQHLVANGSDGLLVCGTTGESPTLSWDEQLALIKTVLAAVGEKVPVLAGTGSNSTGKRWKPPAKPLPWVPMGPWWLCPTTTARRRKGWRPISAQLRPQLLSCH